MRLTGSRFFVTICNDAEAAGLWSLVFDRDQPHWTKLASGEARGLGLLGSDLAYAVQYVFREHRGGPLDGMCAVIRETKHGLKVRTFPSAYDIHGLHVHDGRLFVTFARSKEVLELDPVSLETLRSWQYKEANHLNDVAKFGGGLFLTHFSPEGFQRKHGKLRYAPQDGGLMTVKEGLHHPHTPTVVAGKEDRLWVCDSGRHRVISLGTDDYEVRVELPCPGFTRGLCFTRSGQLLVGCSHDRHDPENPGEACLVYFDGAASDPVRIPVPDGTKDVYGILEMPDGR